MFMTEAENREALERMFGVDGTLLLSPQEEYEIRAPDCVIDMPQSGERIVGRDKMREMQEHFPNPPAAQVRRITGSGDLFVMEARSDYGEGGIFHVADIVEFRDGKIVRETRYYGEPFDAPDWRASWVEPIQD